jgi:hypothetical protein
MIVEHERLVEHGRSKPRPSLGIPVADDDRVEQFDQVQRAQPAGHPFARHRSIVPTRQREGASRQSAAAPTLTQCLVVDEIRQDSGLPAQPLRRVRTTGILALDSGNLTFSDHATHYGLNFDRRKHPARYIRRPQAQHAACELRMHAANDRSLVRIDRLALSIAANADRSTETAAVSITSLQRRAEQNGGGGAELDISTDGQGPE